MKIFYDELKKLVIEKLVESGVLRDDAEKVADCYVTADLYGVTSHGVSILPMHLKRLECKGYNLEPSFKVVKEGTSYQVIDGDNAIGVLSAIHCIDIAVRGAKKNGIYIVNSFNNNTLGPAFYYSLKMAQEKLIGIIFCNSPAQMTVPNGKSKLLGTNPLSIAIPNGDRNIILDMATSAVAKSKINQMKEKGEQIPFGWALDENFQPTQDAEAALRGYVLPMAGFKGYGLSMMIDIIAGVLSGAGYLDKVGRFYSTDFSCMNVGFSFIAIDPEQIYGKNFENVIQEYVKRVEEDNRIDNDEKIFLPGYDRLDAKDKNNKNGIEISKELYDFLRG